MYVGEVMKRDLEEVWNVNIWEFRRSINKTDKNKRWFWKNIKIDNFLTNQNKREDKIRKFRNPLVINQQKLKVLKENIMNNFMSIN